METEKKEHIITVAEDMFARYGIQKTTMDEIAKTAKIGKATLYHFFLNKENVFQEVIKKESKHLRKKLIAAVDKSTNPEQQFQNYILTRMKHVRELGNYFATLRAEYFKHYTFVENERKNFADFEISILKQILDTGVEKKIFSIKDTDAVSRVLSKALKGFELSYISKDKQGNAKKDIDLLLSLLIDGFKCRQ